MVALTYGPKVDWYRNVSAAGYCRIIWHRTELLIVKVEPLEAKTGLPYFPLFERIILRLAGIQHFAKLYKWVG